MSAVSQDEAPPRAVILEMAKETFSTVIISREWEGGTSSDIFQTFFISRTFSDFGHVDDFIRREEYS